MKALSIGNYNRGVATLEILIAFAILTLSMSAMILVVFENQSIAIDSQTNDEAIAKAQAQLEAARALSRQDFNSVVSIAPVSDDIYQKKLDVQSIDSTTKKVTSTVSWSDLGRTLAVDFTTLLTNPVASGSSCSTTITGDWTAPQKYGYASVASSLGATAVSVRSNRAYVTSDPNSSGTSDFYVFDTSNAGLGNPILPTIGRFSTTYGLTDVRTVGNFAYVTADSSAYQFLVIDVSDPAHLAQNNIVAKEDITAPGDSAVGNTIFYADNKVYVGLTKSKGAEFHIFDVSIPTIPVEVGKGYEVGSAINSIVVKNNIAYLATAANNEIIELNVSDPTNITLIGSYSSATLTGQSLALDSSGSLYFGRIGGIGNPKLLNFTSNMLTTPVWSMNMSSQSGAYSLTLRGPLLFMTTADPTDGFQIWDVSNASASVAPTRWDTSPLNIQQNKALGTDCDGNLFYVSEEGSTALQIIGPSAVTPPGTFDYMLTPAFNSLSVSTGSSVSNNVTVAMTVGPTKAVTLTASGMQSGVSFTASPTSSCTPNASCVILVTFTASSGAQKQTNTITVTGTAPTRTTSFQLTVN